METEMTHAFHKFWLKITAIIIGIAGPLFTLGTMPNTSAPARLILDILGWRWNNPTSFDMSEIRFLSALTGGFLVGWGVMVWLMSTLVYDHAPEGVRRTIVFGLIAWFCFDSTGSFLSGHPSNVAFNVLVLITAVGPLWRPATETT